eukprot:jgi/Mesen1/7472/ME000039S06691
MLRVLQLAKSLSRHSGRNTKQLCGSPASLCGKSDYSAVSWASECTNFETDCSHGAARPNSTFLPYSFLSKPLAGDGRSAGRPTLEAPANRFLHDQSQPPVPTGSMLQRHMASMSRWHLAAAETSTSTSGEASEPVRSPLLQTPPPPGEGSDSKAAAKTPRTAQAVLTGIKQSPKKVNLVAALVRGMRVQDAVHQLAVSSKRAAKTVSKILQAARANGVQNHGLDGSKLVVGEAFVGKNRYLKRNFPHGRAKSGIRERPRCMLTVVVAEMSKQQERQMELSLRVPVHRRKRTKLTPHTLLEVTPSWARRRALEKVSLKQLASAVASSSSSSSSSPVETLTPWAQ